MSDTKDKIKDGIDRSADKAKEVTEDVADSTKEAAHDVGEKVKETGQKIKDAANKQHRQRRSPALTEESRGKGGWGHRPRRLISFPERDTHPMLRWAIIFAVLALVAGVLGFGGLAGDFSYIAKSCS